MTPERKCPICGAPPLAGREHCRACEETRLLVRRALSPPKTRRPWTAEEILYLQMNRTLTDKQLAGALDRTRVAISAKRAQLGIVHRRYQCPDCGQWTATRVNCRCSACSVDHHREIQKPIVAAHHEIHRPSPTPVAQSDPELPPHGALIYHDDGSGVQCHVCGKFFGSLVKHVRMHGFDGDSYKEAFGLGRTWSLLSPATAEKFRQAAIARDQANVGRKGLADMREAGIQGVNPKGRPDRLGSRVRKSEGTKGKPKSQKANPSP